VLTLLCCPLLSGKPLSRVSVPSALDPPGFCDDSFVLPREKGQKPYPSGATLTLVSRV
jgi:hypothetical protein